MFVVKAQSTQWDWSLERSGIHTVFVLRQSTGSEK